MKVPSVTGVFSAPEPRLSTLSRTCTELPERTVLCRFAHVRSAESRCEADRQGGTEVMRRAKEERWTQVWTLGQLTLALC